MCRRSWRGFSRLSPWSEPDYGKEEQALITEVRYPNVEVRVWEAYPFVYYWGDEDDEEAGDYQAAEE